MGRSRHGGGRGAGRDRAAAASLMSRHHLGCVPPSAWASSRQSVAVPSIGSSASFWRRECTPGRSSRGGHGAERAACRGPPWLQAQTLRSANAPDGAFILRATVVVMDRNRWSPSVGTGGRHRRNAHDGRPARPDAPEVHFRHRSVLEDARRAGLPAWVNRP
jgi:hypothetical protein